MMLSGMVLGVITWQVLVLAHDFVSHPLSIVLWLNLIAAVPTYLFAIIGSLCFFRGGPRRAARFIWYAIAISLLSVVISFFGPVPAVPLLPVPTMLGFLGRVSVQAVNVGVGAAFVIASRWGDSREASSMRALSRQRFWGWSAGITTVLLACAAIGHRVDHQMVERLDSAIFEPDMDARRAAFERAVALYSGSRQGSEAQLLLALHLQRARRTSDAMALFAELLTMHFSDLVPTEGPWYQYEPAARHEACLGMSSCFESDGDLAGALHYARLARRKHPPSSWCGTCIAEENDEVEK
jgi:hypothetical protein